VFVATSYSRGTPFLHCWGWNFNPPRLAVGKSAGRDAKLSLYSTDCMVQGGSLEFESRMQFRNAVPIRKLIQFVARGRIQDCSEGSTARLPLANCSRFIPHMLDDGMLTPSNHHLCRHYHRLCRCLRRPLRLLPRPALVAVGHRPLPTDLSRGIPAVFCSCPMVRRAASKIAQAGCLSNPIPRATTEKARRAAPK
jgi:hypothetical protein